MNSFIQPAIGSVFLLAAVILGIGAARAGRAQYGRWSIVARSRFRIAVIFAAVGAVLTGFYILSFIFLK